MLQLVSSGNWTKICYNITWNSANSRKVFLTYNLALHTLRNRVVWYYILIKTFEHNHFHTRQRKLFTSLSIHNTENHKYGGVSRIFFCLFVFFMLLWQILCSSSGYHRNNTDIEFWKATWGPSAIYSVSIEPLSVLHSKLKFEW